MKTRDRLELSLMPALVDLIRSLFRPRPIPDVLFDMADRKSYLNFLSENRAI